MQQNFQFFSVAFQSRDQKTFSYHNRTCYFDKKKVQKNLWCTRNMADIFCLNSGYNSINQFLKYFSNWKLLAKLWRNVGTKILELVLLPYVSKKLWLLWMLTKINLDLLLPFKFNPSLPWIEDAFQTDHSAMLWSMQGVFLHW